MSDTAKRLREHAEWHGHGVLPRQTMREAAEEIERLRALLEEAATDLGIHADYDHQNRDTYPAEMRRYKRDMDLVNRIREAIRGEADHEKG